ncbi:MAG: class I SAM-dependent methyltransferase [Candidatus Delongbacteria bacterium]
MNHHSLFSRALPNAFGRVGGGGRAHLFTKENPSSATTPDASPPSPAADPGRHGHELYSHAELYDIAYDWDVTRELQFVLTCMEFYGPGEPARILEPACGTGRNLVCLGHMGLEAVGYDVNRETLAFATRRLAEEGLEERCRALPGDMRDFRLEERFDGAYTAINSFRYLIADAEVRDHLQAVAAMLVKGGVYVVDLSYAMPPRRRPRTIRWSAGRDPVQLQVVWRTREDLKAGLSHETCTLEVESPEPRIIETRHTTRLWQPAEFRQLVEGCGFRLDAIYDAGFQHLPDHPPPHGGLDNLYHVLVKER